MLNNKSEEIDFHNLKIKKKYGQNFLVDKNIIKKIISAVNIKKDDIIIEIGAGLGALTQYFLCAKKIIAIEIDGDLIGVLQKKFDTNKNFELINGDILKLNLEKITHDYKNIKIVSNLPYYISTAIITKCLYLENLKSLTIMIQKEVAERIFAVPSTKAYGSLSILSQYFAKPEIITNVSPNCFIPKPNVESIVLNMIMRKDKGYCHQELLFKVVRHAFSKRRKTLINCLDNFNGLSKNKIAYVLSEINLDKNIRGESLTLDKFIELSDKLYELIKLNKT